MFKTTLKNNFQLFNINFSDSYWKVINKKKLTIAIITFFTMLPHLFWSISPFLIAKIFEAKSISLCLIIFAIWLIVNFGEAYGYKLNASFQLEIIHSVQQNAHQHLLTIDPKYHVHRSSGSILGKIDRAARGFEDLLDQILLEFGPLIMGITITLFAMAYYSWFLFIVVSCLIIFIIALGYYFVKYISVSLEKDFIISDDKFRNAAVENVAQVRLIRTTFASDFISNKLVTNIKNNIYAESKVWLFYTLIYTIIRTIYLCTLCLVIITLINKIKKGDATILSASALVIAYIRNTQILLKIMVPFRRYMRGLVAIKDLFNFMSNFGKQNYPVLGTSSIIVDKQENINLQANQISFDYETAKLFNDHSLNIECSKEQTNKLFGIIGASGTGKTTLISILGGQLKPIKGEICINNINIYKVTDSTRRQLISLQGQVATSMKGSVKYNLLFGLPNNDIYSDDYLLEILNRVGLLNVLQTHQGLQTQLGEGGLNLSGGQRQRLNFASLYLRSQYYKPAIILIDEPTSSLDEISEKAITNMIKELAINSITLVIAHRLKTVEDAHAILDLSLLNEEKDIVAYPPSILINKSPYYKKLIEGKVQIDN